MKVFAILALAALAAGGETPRQYDAFSNFTVSTSSAQRLLEFWNNPERSKASIFSGIWDKEAIRADHFGRKNVPKNAITSVLVVRFSKLFFHLKAVFMQNM